MMGLLRYYVWGSYRRKLIDKSLDKNKKLFSGIVLDIGGRGRGRFVKPKTEVKKWIFADINEEYHPDIVLDVAQMDSIETESIDVICACELFEHVKDIERGIRECYRILKTGGLMVISVPFLYAIHADPSDYQRWTETKWRNELGETGFDITTCIIMGRFFTILADNIKTLFRSLPRPLRWGVILCAPLLDLVVLLDKSALVTSHHLLNKFHGGYFMVVKK